MRETDTSLGSFLVHDAITAIATPDSILRFDFIRGTTVYRHFVKPHKITVSIAYLPPQIYVILFSAAAAGRPGPPGAAGKALPPCPVLSITSR
jgi:hypothetical protein